MRGLIDLRISDLLHVPHPLVVAPGGGVKDVEHLREVRVPEGGGDLVDGILRAAKGVAQIKERLAAAVRQRVHPVVDVVRAGVVGVGLVEVQIEHQIFDCVVLQKVEGVVSVILGVAAIDEQIIEAGVQILVELLHTIGSGAGGPDDVGIKFLMVVLQPGHFGGAGVVGLVVAVPMEDRVSKDAEWVGQDVDGREDPEQQEHGQDPEPGFVFHCLPRC